MDLKSLGVVMFLDVSMNGKKFMGFGALWRNISGVPASQTTEILKSLDMDTEIPTEKTDMFKFRPCLVLFSISKIPTT